LTDFELMLLLAILRTGEELRQSFEERLNGREREAS